MGLLGWQRKGFDPQWPTSLPLAQKKTGIVVGALPSVAAHVATPRVSTKSSAGVALQQRPGDGGIAGIAASALLGTKDDLGIVAAALISRAPIRIRR